MHTETKVCQNCKDEFTIEPEDFDFYQKVNVPAPTFCPDCRTRRRMVWRNERSLYKRPCEGLEGTEETISMIAPESPFVVYTQKKWWSDDWDALSYGRDYDFSRPFFEQFKELLHEVPVLALLNTNAVNSDYANFARDTKDSYLLTAAWQNENVSYSNRVTKSRDSMDLYLVGVIEKGYEVVNAGTSTNVRFSYGVEDCIDTTFAYDCRGCNNIFGCVGLRNKSYCIFNKQYTKEEYFKELKKYDLGSYKELQNTKKKYREFVGRMPHKYLYGVKNQNVTGDIIIHSKNVKDGFDVVETEDSRYVQWLLEGVKGSYDIHGAAKLEQSYEVVASGIGAQYFWAVHCFGGQGVRYAYNCHSSDNVFGCSGLRGKKYCILNKQYTKEEYEALLPKIIQHMQDMPYVDEFGRTYGYGEFFPPGLSPFAYNETIAQEYMPLTKEEAKDFGMPWREGERPKYNVTVEAKDLPDHINDVTDDITKEIIGCAYDGAAQRQCTKAFRITPKELAFYRAMNVALPRLCPNCRHYERLAQRNPQKLWKRQCMKVFNDEGGTRECKTIFQTPYAPDRKEIIYCEPCYQQEVI